MNFAISHLTSWNMRRHLWCAFMQYTFGRGLPFACSYYSYRLQFVELLLKHKYFLFFFCFVCFVFTLIVVNWFANAGISRCTIRTYKRQQQIFDSIFSTNKNNIDILKFSGNNLSFLRHFHCEIISTEIFNLQNSFLVRTNDIISLYWLIFKPFHCITIL